MNTRDRRRTCESLEIRRVVLRDYFWHIYVGNMISVLHIESKARCIFLVDLVVQSEKSSVLVIGHGLFGTLVQV